MFLIMSGAYIGQELQTEFGRIPPSFLPLGNKRLFRHQIELAPAGTQIYLTIPESYSPSKTDLNFLIENKVKVLSVPDHLKIGAALIAALNLSEHDFSQPLHLLFGDTLFKKLPSGYNFASLSLAQENYHWGVTTEGSSEWVKQIEGELDANDYKVINGYFKFSQPRELLRALAHSNWDFLKALNEYHRVTDFIGITTDDWLDFGHVNTYFSSKAHFTTQRAFNNLRITSSWVEKSSSKDKKIAAESNWFLTLPLSLRHYVPQYLGEHKTDGKSSYRLEYLHNTAVNELYVFSEHPTQVWKKIISNCIQFLKSCSKEKAPRNSKFSSLKELLNFKTESRLQEFLQQSGYDINQVWKFEGYTIKIKEAISLANKHINFKEEISVLHGDFCFSNILYDFRSNRIKTIDPRGLTLTGEPSIYGNIHYDIAKLSHSIIGLYDWIIAGYYKLEVDKNSVTFSVDIPNNQEVIQKYFIHLVLDEFKISEQQVLAMQIHLFFSMLPLHNDNKQRQQALFFNAFRLYKKLLKISKED